jgi:hypothetical protein
MTCITQHDFPITQAKMALSHRVFLVLGLYHTKNAIYFFLMNLT